VFLQSIDHSPRGLTAASPILQYCLTILLITNTLQAETAFLLHHAFR